MEIPDEKEGSSSELVVWGLNDDGQLGIGKKFMKEHLTQVFFLR